MKQQDVIGRWQVNVTSLAQNLRFKLKSFGHYSMVNIGFFLRVIAKN